MVLFSDQNVVADVYDFFLTLFIHIPFAFIQQCISGFVCPFFFFFFVKLVEFLFQILISEARETFMALWLCLCWLL